MIEFTKTEYFNEMSFNRKRSNANFRKIAGENSDATRSGGMRRSQPAVTVAVTALSRQPSQPCHDRRHSGHRPPFSLFWSARNETPTQ